jgi:ABC-2 type transport system permease protein
MTAPPTATVDVTPTTTEDEVPTMTTTELPLPTDRAIAASPARTRDLGRLPAVLRSEWIKSTTVRTNKTILAAAGVVGLLSSWATAVFIKGAVLTAAEVATGATALTAVLAAIAGILLFTAEAQHGTLAGALTAQPARWPIVAGKAVVAIGLGLALGVIGLLTGFAGALAGGLEVGDTSGLPSTVLWVLLYICGSAVLGLGVGMVVRHSAGAVSGLLVWWLVVEGLIVQLAPGEVVRFVPFDTGWRSLGIESHLDPPAVVAAGLSNPLHASIFWGYVLAALVIGAVLVHRRDAT